MKRCFLALKKIAAISVLIGVFEQASLFGGLGGYFVAVRLSATSTQTTKSSNQNRFSLQFIFPRWLLYKPVIHQILCLVNAIFHFE